MRDAALKYQTQPAESMSNELPTKFSVQDLEALVLKAVEKKEPNEVRVCNHMLHTLLHAEHMYHYLLINACTVCTTKA